MNANTRIRVTLVTVMLTFGLFPLEQSTLAHSLWGLFGPRGNSAQSASAQSPNSNCKEIRVSSIMTIESFEPLMVFVGTFTNAGILNGTTEHVFDFATDDISVSDPNLLSFYHSFTLTTGQGQLKGREVYIYNLVTGNWTAVAEINSNTSTGRFAGATGVVYFNGRTEGVFPDSVSFPSDVLAQICFAQ